MLNLFPTNEEKLYVVKIYEKKCPTSQFSNLGYANLGKNKFKAKVTRKHFFL